MSKRNISYSEPYIAKEDVKAVAGAIRELRLSQGEYVRKFENEFVGYLGCNHAISAMNGTAALHLAMLALDIQPGDEVIVPTFTFAATANCILYVGAKPVFADIDPRTYNVTAQKISEVISSKTKAIIVVHYGGQCADMDPIMEVATKHGLYVVEDACEAHGALYKNRKAGTMGDIGCFSFYPNKNMTTGEGGMVVTNNDEYADKIRLLRSHGQDYRYHHVALVYNYRMTDIQAALGRVQLRRLNWVIQRKLVAAKYYEKLLKNVQGVETPYVMPHDVHTYMFYTIKMWNEKLRDKVKQHLQKAGVETATPFPPIHLQPLYRLLFGYKEGLLPVSEDAAKRVLALPIYPRIKREDQDFIVNLVIGGIKK